MKPRPPDAPPRYNGSGTPCDMDEGPCSCGAWHKEEETKMKPDVYSIPPPTFSVRAGVKLTHPMSGVWEVDFIEVSIDRKGAETIIHLLSDTRVDKLGFKDRIGITLKELMNPVYGFQLVK